MSTEPAWVVRGKTIRGLIGELMAFDDHDIEVRISLDGSDTTHCISLVARVDGKAVLMNCEGDP